MLQNACNRYDIAHKLKPSVSSRAIYQHDLHNENGDDDNPSNIEEQNTYFEDSYQVNSTNFNRNPNVKTLIPYKKNNITEIFQNMHRGTLGYGWRSSGFLVTKNSICWRMH